jgi:hypothetical protein
MVATAEQISAYHDISIGTRDRSNPLADRRAHCTCDWEGDWKHTRSEAIRSGAGHKRAMTRLARKQRLAEREALSAKVTWRDISDNWDRVEIAKNGNGVDFRYRGPDGAYLYKFVTTVDVGTLLTEGRLGAGNRD